MLGGPVAVGVPQHRTMLPSLKRFKRQRLTKYEHEASPICPPGLGESFIALHGGGYLQPVDCELGN